MGKEPQREILSRDIAEVVGALGFGPVSPSTARKIQESLDYLDPKRINRHVVPASPETKRLVEPNN